MVAALAGAGFPLSIPADPMAIDICPSLAFPA
jgi:hypothetical protein